MRAASPRRRCWLSGPWRAVPQVALLPTPSALAWRLVTPRPTAWCSGRGSLRSRLIPTGACGLSRSMSSGKLPPTSRFNASSSEAQLSRCRSWPTRCMSRWKAWSRGGGMPTASAAATRRARSAAPARCLQQRRLPKRCGLPLPAAKTMRRATSRRIATWPSSRPIWCFTSATTSTRSRERAACGCTTTSRSWPRSPTTAAGTPPTAAIRSCSRCTRLAHGWSPGTIMSLTTTTPRASPKKRASIRRSFCCDGPMPTRPTTR